MKGNKLTKLIFTTAVAVLLVLPYHARANDREFSNYNDNGLQNAIQHAIDTHPEVRAKWHNFIAAGYSENAAKAGYRPNLDLNMGYNSHHKDYGPNRNWDGGYADITLRQMIYDGSFTQAEVARFNSLQLVRYFELLEVSEQVAYEAFAAYLNIFRQRDLVDLARKNLTTHHKVFEQIQKSSKAGVARTSDLEQIKGRMALSQTNVITELTNLHDYSARYLRLIGAPPPKDLKPFRFDKSPLPKNIKETLLIAYRGSPIYHAALRNIMAAESTVIAERSSYFPRLDLKARYGGQNHDNQGYRDGQSSGSIGLELTYNLYSGSKNRSSIKRALEEVNSAKDQRDLACLNIRQTVQIGFNDAKKLEEQLPILNQHRTSSEKVSLAYKKQFDIGQRSLLDLLDVESEHFQANRAWTNARYDLDIARARTLAAMGKLIHALNLVQQETPNLADLGEDMINVDEQSACPAYDINEYEVRLQDADMDGINDSLDQCPQTPMTDVVDEKGCSVFIDKVITRRLNVQFKLESTVVDKQYYPEIQQLAEFLKRFPNTKVEISGHSSLGGSDQLNDRLSKERAEAIAHILSGFFGIAPSRIKAEGYGTRRLIVKEKSPEADKINRRMEARVTAIEQVPLKKD